MGEIYRAVSLLPATTKQKVFKLVPTYHTFSNHAYWAMQQNNVYYYDYYYYVVVIRSCLAVHR
jgi:hypothetical protein